MWEQSANQMQVGREVPGLLEEWWGNCGLLERLQSVHLELLCVWQHIGSPGGWGSEGVVAVVN